MPYIEPTKQITEPILLEELNISEGAESLDELDWETHTEGSF